MATRKVTLSLEADSIALAEQAAARAGISTSAWLSRAARREAVRVGYTPPPARSDGDDVERQALADEEERAAAEEERREAR